MDFKTNKPKILTAFLSLVLYFLLSYSLTVIIQPGYYEFVKFDNGDAGLLVWLLSYIIPVILTIILAIVPNSEFIYIIQFFVLVVIIYPAAIVFREFNSDIRIIILNVVYFFAIYFIGNSLKLRIRVPVMRENQKIFFLAVISIVLIVPFVVIFGPHLDFQNLLLSNIYESRDVEMTLSNPYTDYLYTPLSNIIIPLFLLLAMLHKEYLKAFFAFALLMFMFLVGGHKLVFFGVFLIVIFYYGNYQQKALIFVTGSILLTIMSIISFHLFHNYLITGFVTRRVFFLPALLEVAYFDFFDSNYMLWSDSVLRSFFTYPYEISTRNLIGQYALGNVKTNANNGIISDGFMNFGVIGSLINIVLVSFIYGIFKTLNINERFFGLIFLLFFTFYSSYFFTSMLTHGVILLIVISYIFLRDTRNAYED
jgi:hypothetical protein